MFYSLLFIINVKVSSSLSFLLPPCASRIPPFTVIGTSHISPCSSSSEVASIISELHPDGVVVELDAERASLLLAAEKRKGGDLFMGADLFSALTVCLENSIPIFLGDEKPSWSGVFTPPPPPPFNPPTLTLINIPRVLISDPLKLLPLVLTVPAILLSLLIAGPVLSSPLHVSVSPVLSLLLSIVALVAYRNAVLLSRDEYISQSSLSALSTLRSLKAGEAVRITWSDAEAAPRGEDDVPVFPLKTEMSRGTEISLNLFEEKWLRMIDSLQLSPGDEIYAVHCFNKFYSPGTSDLIFPHSEVRKITVQSVEEGKRAGGQRKVSLVVVPGDIIEESLSFFGTSDGYMIARSSDPVDCREQQICNEPQTKGISKADPEILVVVGLAHANGVLARLAGDLHAGTGGRV